MLLPRRTFIRTAAGAGFATALGDLGFLGQLPRVSAAEARLPASAVRMHADIEPLVRFLEETPRERLLEEVAARLRRGLTYRELLAALLLAGVRNIEPRPVGFKFHAVLVVNSAHLASLASAESDRWLPIFWALDQFKSSQAADVREGDWAMAPVDESRVPPGHRARAAFIEAMDRWDEAAADVAITGLARTAGANEIFELLCRYGVRDFREIGHKQIYIANAFRTLEVIGWQYAEPVLRGITYALQDRLGDANPSQSDLPADRPFRRSVETVREFKQDWLDGRPSADATREFLLTARAGSAVDTSRTVVELLSKNVAPSSILDAFHAASGEMLMRRPGILALHASTFTNAVRYAWNRCRDDETRRLLLLQNAAFLPLFRREPTAEGVQLDALEPAGLSPGGSTVAVDEIFADVGKDTLSASRKLLAWARDNPDPKPFADAARRLIFLKGRDSHDYKFSSAVLEDYQQIAPPWRERVLAASLFHLRGSRDSDNDLVKRTRSALSA